MNNEATPAIKTTFSLRNRKAATQEPKNVKNTLDALILGK